MSRLNRIADAVGAFISNMYSVHPETRVHCNIRCPYVAELADSFLSNSTPRDRVYAAIDSERDYQDRVWAENAGKVAGAQVRTVAEELLMLEEYVSKARAAWTVAPRSAEVLITTDILRKCAGICVRAMENHGAPERVVPTT